MEYMYLTLSEHIIKMSLQSYVRDLMTTISIKETFLQALTSKPLVNHEKILS